MKCLQVRLPQRQAVRDLRASRLFRCKPREGQQGCVGSMTGKFTLSRKFPRGVTGSQCHWGTGDRVDPASDLPYPRERGMSYYLLTAIDRLLGNAGMNMNCSACPICPHR